MGAWRREGGTPGGLLPLADCLSTRTAFPMKRMPSAVSFEMYGGSASRATCNVSPAFCLNYLDSRIAPESLAGQSLRKADKVVVHIGLGEAMKTPPPLGIIPKGSPVLLPRHQEMACVTALASSIV